MLLNLRTEAKLKLVITKVIPMILTVTKMMKKILMKKKQDLGLQIIHLHLR